MNYELSKLYRDFTLSLFSLIFDTYMGDDLTNNADKLKHFEWCWNKNINNFKEEDIYFNETDEAYDWLLEFVFETYYFLPNKENNPNIPITIKKIVTELFSFPDIKTHQGMENFVRIYKILDKSLKK